MATLKPLGSRVVVKRSKAETTKGGIILPDSAQEKPKQGTVIAVGPGKTNEDGTVETMTVQTGNEVLFSSYAGTEVKYPGAGEDEEYLILKEEDILGILETA